MRQYKGMVLNINKHDADSLAVVDSAGNKLRYGELVEFSEELKRELPNRSLVFVFADNDAGGIAWSMGFINTGIVPLLLNPKIDGELLEQLYSIYQPGYVCVPSRDAKRFGFGQKLSRFGYSLLKTGNMAYPLHEKLSHLLPTSGSTGSPKLVRHSYENVEASALNISTFFQLKKSDRPLLVLPLYYTMGLSVVFSHLFVGATILATDLSMTQREFWIFFKEQKATSFTGVPYSFEILRMMRFFRMALPDLELLTQGGGKLSRELNLQFVEYARQTGKRWIATYGQTEGTARMAYLPPEFALSKCGSIGKAVPNGELYLTDTGGQVIEENNREGELCYRGKNVTLGYALCKEDLALGDTRNGSLKTGDLAYRDSDGFYYIVGRTGRFLKLYGTRVGLDECEHIIKSKYPIECGCVGTDVKMMVYITRPELQEQVKGELVVKTGIVASAFEVRVIPELPKNNVGKILYSKLSNQ